MIVRCGRCKVDLEVAGAGEFICPNCGTRNAVRAPAPPDPFGVPDLGATSLSQPMPPQSAPDEPPAGIKWVSCPGCSYRFALGEVDEVSCPACSRRLVVSEDGVSEVHSA